MKQKHISSLSRNDKEKRRLKTAKMFKKGKTQAEVAKKFNVTPAATNQWYELWKKGGQEALKSKGHPGFLSKLVEDNRQKLKKILLSGLLGRRKAKLR